ncbi:unnamed protein product [Microthlaspi erraticum]|uniref:VPS9 domain-containing protein n=1 Tax=Microthlaspi erraticum TaxID=1685480 RepID=A0A6D2HFP9_9BRAS|nr:unnamed protein product [Microthlaspi erraticum]
MMARRFRIFLSPWKWSSEIITFGSDENIDCAVEDHIRAQADEFLPILVYVIIKANRLHFHSNLTFTLLCRRKTKFVWSRVSDYQSGEASQ